MQLFAPLFFPMLVHGAVVTTLIDEDDGSLGSGNGVSLREAVKYSPVADTITFAPALSGETIRLTLADANCGESSGCITIKRSSSFTLTLDHCTLTRNAGYHASALECGRNPGQPSDAITIRNSTISRNSVVKGVSLLGARCRALQSHHSKLHLQPECCRCCLILDR